MIDAQPYRLDRANARWLGVCSGLAEKTGLDVTLIRVGVVLATLFAIGPVALLIYLVVALVAGAR
ncbi:MAG: PspC domain-containing protein [Sphingomonadaceae bacterium]|nr:PspC domain-containing protein [Sphingomonadaceae bacterium]